MRIFQRPPMLGLCLISSYARFTVADRCGARSVSSRIAGDFLTQGCDEAALISLRSACPQSFVAGSVAAEG